MSDQTGLTEPELRSLIAEVGGIAPDFPREAHLYHDLGLPSVKALYLLTELEDRLGISIPDEEYIEATSLVRLMDLLGRLTQ